MIYRVDDMKAGRYFDYVDVNEGLFVAVLGLSIDDKSSTSFFATGAMGVYMALHGTVEDETLMVVVCYERMDRTGGTALAPLAISRMRMRPPITREGDE